jgi:hypothetical protein
MVKKENLARVFLPLASLVLELLLLRVLLHSFLEIKIGAKIYPIICGMFF